jgi:preprotein translocase subunit SecG
MGVISVILLILFVIASLLLIFVVSIQTEAGTGLGGIFGGGSDSTFGSQTGKVLNKVTAILGAAFIVLAIILAVVNKSQSADSLLDSVKVEQVQGSGEWWNDEPAK